MSDLKTLTDQIIKFRDERNWRQFHTPKDVVLSLLLEAAELAEHVQWKNSKELEAYIGEQTEALGEELSDILYWVLLISHDFGVDLEEAFARKMRKNEEKYPADKARDRHDKYSKL